MSSTCSQLKRRRKDLSARPLASRRQRNHHHHRKRQPRKALSPSTDPATRELGSSAPTSLYGCAGSPTRLGLDDPGTRARRFTSCAASIVPARGVMYTIHSFRQRRAQKDKWLHALQSGNACRMLGLTEPQIQSSNPDGNAHRAVEKGQPVKPERRKNVDHSGSLAGSRRVWAKTNRRR